MVKQKKLKLRLSKKAVIQVQLNWIFVTIIGAIILFFFITIVTKQKAISETELTSEIVSDLDDLITGAQVATGGASEIPIPDITLEFTCNEYKVNNQRLPIGERIVFGSSQIKDRSLVVWSVPWKLPYKVTDFLFITAPNIKYVFAYDFQSRNAQKYHDIFINYIPDNINKIEVDIPTNEDFSNAFQIDFPDENDYAIKIISIGFPVIPPDFAYDTKTDIIVVPRYNADIEHFTDPVEFFKFDKTRENFISTGETTFIDKSSLMGAMFSGNIDDYKCTMNKVFTNLNALNKVHMERTKLLDNANLPTSLYGESLSNFEAIDVATQDVQKWEDNAAQIFNSAKDLDRQNAKIEQLSLPLLY